ncbi:MAG: hypothetical protein MR378_00160 [Ruminococcus sp.]|nr:hypothetical protein [Ruminococcus sp.]
MEEITIKISDDRIIFDNGYTISTAYIRNENALTTLSAVYSYSIRHRNDKKEVTVKDMIELYEPGAYNKFHLHEKLLSGAVISKLYSDGKISGLKRSTKKRGNTWLYHC